MQHELDPGGPRVVGHAGEVVEVDTVLDHHFVGQVAAEQGELVTAFGEGVGETCADLERVAVELLRLVEEEALRAVIGPAPAGELTKNFDTYRLRYVGWTTSDPT